MAHKILADQEHPDAGGRTLSTVDPEARRGKHGEWYDGYVVDILADADSELITEINVLPAGGGEPLQITHLNSDRLAKIAFGDYEQFSFTGAHGDEVFGYLIKPVNFDPTQTYPLAFLIHGGPQGSFDDHWHYRWNPQIYAAHGYATVMIDFHGSTGYGQAFTDAINGDWGGAPFEDLMTGLDWLLERHDWIDPDRMAIAGGSYGGYLTSWLMGRTDRFAAAWAWPVSVISPGPIRSAWKSPAPLSY